MFGKQLWTGIDGEPYGRSSFEALSLKTHDCLASAESEIDQCLQNTRTTQRFSQDRLSFSYRIVTFMDLYERSSLDPAR